MSDSESRSAQKEIMRGFRQQVAYDMSFISNIVLLIHHVAQGSAQNARVIGIAAHMPATMAL